MKSILNIALSITILLALLSCKKDKENPTITIVEPTNHSEHLWGAEVLIEATFEDHSELKSYRVHIGTEAGELTPEFDVEFASDITGKTYDFYEHFIVPDSIEPVYYLHFEVVNVAGKSTENKLMLHFKQ